MERAVAALADRRDEIIRRWGAKAKRIPVCLFYLKTRQWSWAKAANFWTTHNIKGKLPRLLSHADCRACGVVKENTAGVKRGAVETGTKPVAIAGGGGRRSGGSGDRGRGEGSSSGATRGAQTATRWNATDCLGLAG